jgi:hypothetical protein
MVCEMPKLENCASMSKNALIFLPWVLNRCMMFANEKSHI